MNFVEQQLDEMFSPDMLDIVISEKPLSILSSSDLSYNFQKHTDFVMNTRSKNVNLTPVTVKSEDEAMTKKLNVSVLQTWASLSEKSKRLNIEVILPKFLEKKIERRSQQRQKEEKDLLKEVDIKEEWRKIEAARKKVEEEKEKLQRLEAAICKEKSNLEEERKQIDEDWGLLHEMKAKQKDSEVELIQTGSDTELAEDDQRERKHSRKRKTTTNDEEESKKAKIQVEEISGKPRLRLRDFSTILATDDLSLEEVSDSNEISDQEEEAYDQEKKEFNEFQRQVVEFMDELNQKEASCKDLHPSDALLRILGEKFSLQLFSSHKATHGTGRGISLTRDYKKQIFRRYFLYFEIRKTANHHLKNYLVYGSLTFDEVLSGLSLKFLDAIIDSNLVMDKNRTIKLTEDNRLWISNVIKFKIDQLKTSL